MHTALKVRPLALAVCSALALMAAPTYAQKFDPNSMAVREAYVGAATQDKKDAALAGLEQLLPQPRATPGGGGCGICNVIIKQPPIDPFIFKPFITSTTLAASDAELGAAGVAVTLDNTRLRALASFTSPRDFVIAASGGTTQIAGSNLVTITGGAIDTNGFNLTLSGNLTANGMLLKEGLGTLAVTGNNVWNTKPYITSGIIEGNSASLQTSMWLSDGVSVRFNQVSDGIFSGVLEIDRPVTLIGRANFEKTGAGKLILTNAQNYLGSTTISGGTLALQGAGSLGITSGLHIGTGATFDISGSTSALPSVGDLSGAGTVVLGSQYLAAGSASDGMFAGTITGAGGLTKFGAGTLTLTGVNTYAGETHILAGTLALAGTARLNTSTSVFADGTFDISASASNHTVGALSGFGTLRLGGNTLTVGGNNTSTTFGGSITGSGGITKNGTGSWTLSGVSTYTGTTTIEQGNLIAKTQSISDRITNNATLTLIENKDVFNPFISAYSGTISGTGKVVKEGDGIIWLRGRNTYTGGTEVKNGILIGNTDSLQGNIINNAALAFYQIGDGTYSGTLSGKGSLYQYGPGTLTLTGDNTYTGGTAFSGTLRVNRDANLGAASGAVVIAGGTLQLGADLTTARTFALSPAGGTIDTNGFKLSTDVSSRISGPGVLTKTGAGTLSLNGTDDPFAVVVTAGRLEVKNVLSTNNVAVSAGAELGGAGYIFGNVNNSGRLARGDGIGAINVEGHVSFDPGSIFLVKTDAAGNSDRLLLTSHRAILNTSAQATTVAPLPPLPPRATLNGGTVDVRAETGNYRRETRYNILTADGGVSGQFSGVTSNLAFLDPSLSYDPNNVYLTLKRNDLSYTTVAQSPNQFAIAQSLNRMANGATGTTGDNAAITAALDGLSAQQARAAFDSIGAAGRAALPQVGSVTQRSVNQNLVARLGLADSGNILAPATGIASRGVQLAFDDSTRNDAAPLYAQLGLPAGTGFRASGSDTSNGMWLRGYGGSGRLDGDASAPGAKYHYGGTLLGYDHKFGNATVGVFAGYAEPRYTQDFSASSAKTKSAQAGVYGRMVSGAWHVDGVASYARNDTNTSRLVSVGGLNRLASGSFNGDAWSAHVETGYTIKAGGFEVQPLAAVSWVRQNQNAYSETGAGALNLILPEQSQDSLRSSLGARTLHPFTAAGMQWMFETRAAWSHEFKTTRSVNARLAGDPTAGVFTVSGPNVPRDSAVLGLGVAAQASKNLRLYADVNTELNGTVRAYALSAGMRYQW